MDSKSKFIFKYICIFLILTASVKSDFKGIHKERIFSIDKPIAEITAHQNEEFIVSVHGNPTTGYGWYLDNSNNGSLQCTNLDKYNSCTDYVVNPHPERMVGVGGVYYFIFKGGEKGDFELKFVNKRPWEKTNYKERTLTVHIE